jgi:hypothetical protein
VICEKCKVKDTVRYIPQRILEKIQKINSIGINELKYLKLDNVEGIRNMIHPFLQKFSETNTGFNTISFLKSL